MAPTQPGQASPWIQAKGDVYARLAVAYEDHNGFSATREDVYAEWGASENWTVSAKVETVDFSRSNSFDSSGYRLSARRRVWTPGNWSFTAGAGVLEGAAIGGFRGCETFGGEISVGAGRSGKFRNSDYFAGATLLHRQHSGECYTNKLELVLGVVRPSGWTTTWQYWAEDGAAGESAKIELMTSQRLGQFEIGAATRTEISGNFDETALVLTIAFRK